MKVRKGSLTQGVTEVVLSNHEEAEVTLWSWGATLAKLRTKDRKRKLNNIVLGLPLEECLSARYFLGVTVGPVAGRISTAQVKLDGKSLKLTQNDGAHHLHGGEGAFDQQNWQVEATGESETECFVTFSYEQADGVNGYPGPLKVSVTYTLTMTNQLVIDYRGISQQTTLFNPTNHSYFNLSGGTERTIENHFLQVTSDYYVPINEENIPLGQKHSVTDTVFDLRKPGKIGDLLAARDKQILLADGLNHGFELKAVSEIKLYHEKSGRQLTVSTTEPAVVLYTGNHFDNQKLVKHGGLAIETQRLPDCEHNKDFGSVMLTKGQEYQSQTIFGFSLLEA